MQLIAQELAIHSLTPYDGTKSPAIKVVHRTSREEAENNDTPLQTENLRRAILALLQKMNPNPDHIKIPRFVIYDTVRVRLPDSFQDGSIDRVAWDFKRKEWKYYVACKLAVASAWYEAADLELMM
ncbi:hypothetical protein OAG34_00155 [bacterium]|jgi:hypothetical protein|nr:hypothetical protein [bacterium]